MAYEAADGFKSTNRAPMMSHKRSMERKSQSGGVSTVDPLQQPEDGGGQEDPSQVAQEHGPAQSIDIQHNHEAGQHHVHSMHPDGHEHQSEHGSAEEAHEHAKKLAGVGEQEQMGESQDEPEYE